MAMRIGELARATGCQVETIRFYEAKGLLAPPARSSNNYRTYGPAHAERLHFIRRCRALGMPLDEIAVLLGLADRPDAPCDGVNALLDRHIDAVARQVVELHALQDALARLRARCDASVPVAQCRILRQLADAPP